MALAVDSLARERDFDELRVDEICEAAGISRSAFYRLFEDKYQIATWCQRFSTDAGIREIGRTLDAAEGNFVTCSGLLLFKNLFRSAGKSQRPGSVKPIARDLHIEYLTRTLREFKGIEIDAELAFQIDYVATSEAEMVGRWLLGDFDADARAFAGLIVSCMPPRLLALVDDPVDHKTPEALTMASFVMSASRA